MRCRFFGGWPFELFVQVWSAILLVHQMIFAQAEEQERDLSLGLTSEDTQELDRWRWAHRWKPAAWEFYVDIPYESSHC